MTKAAITVENLSKVYRIGVRDKANDSMGRGFLEFVKSPVKNYLKYRSLYRFSEDELSGTVASDDILWALNDVSFSARRTFVFGIHSIPSLR